MRVGGVGGGDEADWVTSRNLSYTRTPAINVLSLLLSSSFLTSLSYLSLKRQDFKGNTRFDGKKPN